MLQAAPSAAGADWREEKKKRDRAKQQEKLNAMPQGMPDYRCYFNRYKYNKFTGSQRKGLFSTGGQS